MLPQTMMMMLFVVETIVYPYYQAKQEATIPSLKRKLLIMIIYSLREGYSFHFGPCTQEAMACIPGALR